MVVVVVLSVVVVIVVMIFVVRIGVIVAVVLVVVVVLVFGVVMMVVGLICGGGWDGHCGGLKTSCFYSVISRIYHFICRGNLYRFYFDTSTSF